MACAGDQDGSGQAIFMPRGESPCCAFKRLTDANVIIIAGKIIFQLFRLNDGSNFYGDVLILQDAN